ncbi:MULTISPECIES: hypothetical protein [unclassified Streptomyces]|uniref:hypothetical protein n=1 Tax=unclassified Streptomyces TaxID=2593676 RepID=UPI0006C02D8F|nr:MULTISPECIES: hypothetical protein [unclassified Streptomyces]KOX01805.1 hypothetical protein ADL02_01455 [Streptomyces sp. NRRL WC-3723]
MQPHIPAGEPVSGWWAHLDERTRREVDAEVLRDRRLPAVRSVWAALRPLGLGLHEAERVVHSRYDALADQVERTPPDPLDVPSLAARAAALPGRVAAIEALWDGDTVHDWFVVLVAVLEGPDGEGHLATVHHRPEGSLPRAAAAEAGRALADHLGVPFHFPSPNVPDDQAPRWREVARPAEGSNRSLKRT